MGNELFQARIDNDFAEQVHKYREANHMSKSEAVREGLRTLVQDEAEAKPIPDGGYITRSEHPWVEPLINVAYYGALVGIGAVVLALAFLLAPLAFPTPDVVIPTLIGFAYASLTVAFVLIIASVGAIAALEHLMHPSEAPIRRYFYSPDEATKEVTA